MRWYSAPVRRALGAARCGDGRDDEPRDDDGDDDESAMRTSGSPSWHVRHRPDEPSA